ncbi:P-loop containing nucleoside triphosphate hydrolase protein [Microdochium trichocladiopsis]|uniref:P-loop containing nucleoside triphosphate hydrolase protein n=1 Tax=Microdochium trichocladiopsis TaxID=1682393 RepID=A0A9P8XUD6_9PEZI|nr:P-loop containing nucleoside triphosphate hydrolase protein [Microdochium trichocladiopsis]KAH7012620.1 P-loop containing nucleoside triphosphate hydrolase protein [Microdochium trichocladiopsis]
MPEPLKMNKTALVCVIIGILLFSINILVLILRLKTRKKSRPQGPPYFRGWDNWFAIIATETTAEAIVSSNPDKSVAVLTYPKRLQSETADRLRKYNNCDVYTFHRMAGKLFPSVVHNDGILTGLRRSRARPMWTERPYDIVILDEMQDCTELLFWLVPVFIRRITRNSGRAPRIVVLGDERQAIYDPAIITGLSPDPWDRMNAQQEFPFINKAFLHEDYIVGSHDGTEPFYIHVNPFKGDLLAAHLEPLIRKHGVERTAILGPSVSKNRAISSLTICLTGKWNMPVAEPVSDNVALDDSVVRGKICVSTIHQFKGSERDLVILYGLDDYYFEMAANQPDDTYPNNIFVALTRSSKQLVAIHNAAREIMPFLDVPQLRRTANHQFLEPETASSFKTRAPAKTTKEGVHLPNRVAASSIARHVSDETLDAIVARHAIITTRAPALPFSEHINAPDVALIDPVRRHFEAVSDINGIAVVAAYEFEVCRTLTTLGHHERASILSKVPKEGRRRTLWLCREACRYLSKLSTYRSRLPQMRGHKFDWLEHHLAVGCARLRDQFPSATPAALDFEHELNATLSVYVDGSQDEANQAQSTTIHGQVDIVQKHLADSIDGSDPHQEVTLWEIKFVSQLTTEQANHGDTVPNVVLYNVRDGEKWEISPMDPAVGLQKLVEEVLRAKYTSRRMLSDDEFLDVCATARKEVEGLF